MRRGMIRRRIMVRDGSWLSSPVLEVWRMNIPDGSADFDAFRKDLLRWSAVNGELVSRFSTPAQSLLREGRRSARRVGETHRHKPLAYGGLHLPSSRASRTDSYNRPEGSGWLGRDARCHDGGSYPVPNTGGGEYVRKDTGGGQAPTVEEAHASRATYLLGRGRRRRGDWQHARAVPRQEDASNITD